MLKLNADALGIIFPNSYDSMVPELARERLMASIPFAGRYRIVDFLLSSMVNAGIDNVSLVVKQNYHSLMDHLGNGREWDLSRKNGGLNLVPPFSDREVKMYSGRVEALSSMIPFLKKQKEKYVIMSDANLAVNFDFKGLLKQHIESGADLTVAYTKDGLPQDLLDLEADTKNLYYTLKMKEDRVSEICVNSKDKGVQNISMNIYVVERELLIQQISEGYLKGAVYYERDILANQLDKLDVRGYCFEGYVARITSVRNYFEESMKMLDQENLDGLFGPSPVYTKIRDDNPTRYMNCSKAKNIMAADGCVIEGEVENCILFRGVKIGKGAKVKNCVLMQDSVVEEGASVEYVITDKKVKISAGKELKGTDSFPVYVEKSKTV
ncbi:MAG: glucose-1-phosphate adenylyltransferase subunit GlgD [Lachnospiraceae bacterium]|nr:glucose-1-phosphate adenylyltransferase subunit GlgD [Lachnospiraceae bacterium]